MSGCTTKIYIRIYDYIITQKIYGDGDGCARERENE